MNPATATHEEQLFLLDCIELLTVLFRGPDAQTCSGLVREGVPQLVSTAPVGAQHLIVALENLQACLPAPDAAPDAVEQFCAELEPRYVHLFISASGGVAAPLYESCHLSPDGSVMGESALCMRDRLQEAGLRVAGPSNEPPDHLAIELEYLYYHLSKGWTGSDPHSLNHALHFADTVMLPWVRRFSQAVAEADPGGFFQRASRLLVGVLESLPPDS